MQKNVCLDATLKKNSFVSTNEFMKCIIYIWYSIIVCFIYIYIFSYVLSTKIPSTKTQQRLEMKNKTEI